MVSRKIEKPTFSKKVIYFIFSTALFLPIFISNVGIFNSMEYSARGYPISLGFSLLLPAIFFVRQRVYPFYFFAATLTLYLTPFFLIGVFKSGSIDLVLISSYSVTVICGYSAFIISRMANGGNYQELFKRSVVLVAAFSFCWAIYQLPNLVILGRGTGDFFGKFVIYQVWVAWPTVLSIAFCLSFYLDGSLSIAVKCAIVFAIFATGAREPFLFIIVFLLTYGLVRRDYYIFLKALSAIFIIGVLIYIFYLNAPDLVISNKISRVLSGEQGVSAGRLQVLGQFDLQNINPFFGTGFSGAGIMGSTHNQYLDLFYRGGMISLFTPILFLFMLSVGFKNADPIIWSVLFAVVVVAFNVNVPIRVPYTGIIIWFLFFLMLEQIQQGQRVNDETNPPKPLHRSNRVG